MQLNLDYLIGHLNEAWEILKKDNGIPLETVEKAISMNRLV